MSDQNCSMSVSEAKISDEADPNPSETMVLNLTYQIQDCETIIEVLESPKPDSVDQPESRDVEIHSVGSSDEDVLTASVHPGKLNYNKKLRTVHQVFELPDSHPLLEKFEERVTDDPSPYLLAVWPTGVISKSFQQHSSGGDLVEPGMCDEINIHSSCRTNGGETIKGTILIPWRTATKGTFPVNGSYFQVNEVFADHESNEHPIDVPKDWICNLPKRSLYCGMSATTLFRGATAEEIQYCFSRGYVCFRGFHKTRSDVSRLNARFHISPCAAGNIGVGTL